VGAANRIDDDFKLNAWNYLRGFRNRIVHEYFGIDYEIVWSVIENDMGAYIELIECLLKQER